MVHIGRQVGEPVISSVMKGIWEGKSVGNNLKAFRFFKVVVDNVDRCFDAKPEMAQH